MQNPDSTGTEEDGSHNPPNIVGGNIQNHEKRNHESTEQKNHGDNKKRKPNWWTRTKMAWSHVHLNNKLNVVFTAIIAVATVANLWILHSSSEQTDKLIQAANIQATSSERSAKASESFASTANRQEVSMEKWSEVSVRPYLWMGTLGFARLDVGQKIAVKFQLANAGKSPAAKIRIKGEILTKYFDTPFTADTPHIAPASRAKVSAPVSDIAAGASKDVTIQSQRPLSQSEKDALGNRKFTVFVVGEVSYSGIYGTEYPVQDFCFAFNPTVIGDAWQICDDTQSAKRPKQ